MPWLDWLPTFSENIADFIEIEDPGVLSDLADGSPSESGLGSLSVDDFARPHSGANRTASGSHLKFIY